MSQKSKLLALSGAFTRFLSSKRLFYGLVAVFAVQAAWIALTGRFEMPFDEKYHVGIIDFFAYHPNPFFSSQPVYLDQFGAVVHSLAYLYHFVMVLPWRVIQGLFSTFDAQVIVLRLLNVTIFSGGLLVFGKVLRKVSISQAQVNLVTFLVIFTPITSQVAGQVNYDNLLFLLFGFNLLLSVGFVEALRRGKNCLGKLMLLASLTMLTLLVKHTYITLALGMLAYVLLNVFKVWRRDRGAFKKSFISDLKLLGRARLIGLSVLLLVSFGLAFERYGLNLIRYGSYDPTCVKAIGEMRCEAHSIYRRGIIYEQNKPAEFNTSPFYFTYLWARHMLFNATTALNGPHSGYSIGLPLPLPYIATVVLGLGGLGLSVVFWRKVFKSPMMRVMALATLVYLAALWLVNYTSYLKYGRRVAVQGRYLVPLLPFLYGAFVVGFAELLRRLPRLRNVLTTILVLCFLAGGGVLTYILHSDNAWYWEKDRAINMNRSAQKVLRPVVPGSKYEPFWQSSLEF